MLKLSVGAILILFGLLLLSPLDDVLVLIPLSLIFGEWIIPLWIGFAIFCLAAGVYLTGSSKHIPNPIANHIWLFASVGIAICIYFFYVLW